MIYHDEEIRRCEAKLREAWQWRRHWQSMIRTAGARDYGPAFRAETQRVKAWIWSLHQWRQIRANFLPPH